MIGWVLQVCGFRLAETSDYFSHVVDLCGGDEETLKPARQEEEEICLPHRGNLEWAWSLSTICCTSVTRRAGHFVFVLFLTLVSVMKHSWPIQTLRWAKRVGWVGKSTRVTSQHLTAVVSVCNKEERSLHNTCVIVCCSLPATWERCKVRSDHWVCTHSISSLGRWSQKSLRMIQEIVICT